MTFETLFGEKFSKFRFGQLLFITAITFGLFAGDVIRRSIAVLALFCLSSKNFEFTPWTKEQKITGGLLVFFCAWLIVVPVIFGENPFSLRLHGAIRPLEITMWIVVTFLFAKDDFFVKNYLNFAVFFCFLYAIIASVYAIQNNFPFAYSYNDVWPFIHGNLETGSIMCGLSACAITGIVTAKNIGKYILCACTLMLATILTICCRFATFWAALAAEYIIAFVCLCCYRKKGILRLLLCVVIELFVVFSLIIIVTKNNLAVDNAIKEQLNQLKITKDFSMYDFTTHRTDIWTETIGFIRQKPMLGYGTDCYNKHSSILPGTGQPCPHAHNTFLHTAFIGGLPLALFLFSFLLMLLILSFKSIFNRQNISCSLTTCLMLTTFLVAGLVEDVFSFPVRHRVIMYFPIFVTMLNLYNMKNKSA